MTRGGSTNEMSYAPGAFRVFQLFHGMPPGGWHGIPGFGAKIHVLLHSNRPTGVGLVPPVSAGAPRPTQLGITMTRAKAIML